MVIDAKTAAGALALLSEPEPEIQEYALQSLNDLVDQFWAEVSEEVTKIETLYESSSLSPSSRSLAALIASKVYYNLQEYDDALAFALGAGDLFEVERKTGRSPEYIETIISKCIDTYIAERTALPDPDDENSDPKSIASIDARLQGIIEGIFRADIDDGEYKQALGVALESSRFDVIQRVLSRSPDADLLSYVLSALTEHTVSNPHVHFREKVLRYLLGLFPSLPTPDYFSTTRILLLLNDAALASSFLKDLSESKLEEKQLVALQMAFDLVDSGTQEFLDLVKSQIPGPSEEGAHDAFAKLRRILTGEESVALYLEFLKQNNHVDMLILKNTKDALEARSSVYHSALSFANAYMHTGTTSDTFLRDNLEWLGRATNWSKFTATAALGLLHKGNLGRSLQLLGPYLPPDNGPSQSAYSEGGALFALGLIHANRGEAVLGYLKNILSSAGRDEVVQHGAALGIGVSGMASGNEDVYEELKAILFSDSAVAGEACGYAMGLVMLGTGQRKAFDEMLQYAHETQHEKIIRGMAMGMAFLYYGKQGTADEVIDLLIKEKDPILRYGGVYTIALAYAGTSDNNAVRRVLHLAVSDTSDDVRRAAVTSLAFLLFKNPTQVPRVVQLLSESYNPHVRYGATLALGISCAGTGLQDAVELLEPMTKDPVDFVRQGAMISLAMILVQRTAAHSPAVTSTRALYAKVIADKHEDPMARFGATLAQGLIDAGGRNVTISLQSRAGGANMSAIVGMALFTQFWYWYPLAHCASLAFSPTAIIGVTGDLKVPKFELVSQGKPSLFAYPAPTKPPTKETVEKVATAVLSTTAKAKARAKTKEQEKGAADGDAMDMPVVPEQKEADGVKPDGETPSHPKKREPTSEKLPNMSRVVPAQLPHIVFPPEGRFFPIRPVTGTLRPPPRKAAKARAPSATAGAFVNSAQYAGGGGIVVLLDKRPGEPVEYIEPEPVAEAAAAPASGMDLDVPPQPIEMEGEEAALPTPFEYPFGEDT
ncbi:putative RPN2-26S proteasome regulatory subunit [Calocera viscosa TUFC12733]|uniref:26S proteasome regulatory subunit RPN2 n=1 Tax=Calocera viscosa (strain TUFC12733) TaxID=1330018 RepID=A0A167M0U4_CALVF|nr:putative RPN2-26S proteasome regulatory subunit [Calocera viscosa TUFC12733]